MNTWKPDGRPEKYGRALGPHTGLMWPLTSPPTRWGDNILGVKLTALDTEFSKSVKPSRESGNAKKRVNPQSGEKAEGGLCLHAEKSEGKLKFLLNRRKKCVKI